MKLVTDMFTFVKESKTLIGELSTINLMYFPKQLAITSSKTGEVVRFSLQRTEDQGNEPNMIGHYISIDKVANVTKLIIFND